MDYFFYHNPETCLGCCACQVACKDHNNLQPGEFFRRVAEVYPAGSDSPVFYSAACNHCENPACMAVCPNGAFYKESDGTVRHTAGKCIGCGRCLWACPYGAISLSSESGTAQKCDGCYDRRMKGLEPVCTAACITHSLQWRQTDGRCSPDSLSGTIPGVLPAADMTGSKTAIHIPAGISRGSTHED